MKPSVVLKPGERASINLPWRGTPNANYEWLKDVCGNRTRPKYDPTTKRFLVARVHAQHVLDALVEEYGRVIVIQFGHAATTCVEQCWNANPNNAIECECGCAGTNHGSKVPFGREVTPGLAVKHELSQATYVVTKDGWELQR